MFGQPWLTEVKDLSIILAGLIALITFVTGTFQYVMQGRAMRANQFIEMRRRFLEDPVFRDLLTLLATDDPRLAESTIQDRRNLVGFLEEVALLMDSKLLKPDVAFYMFGYYASLISNSKHFWIGLDKDGPYWMVFRKFAKDLAAYKPELKGYTGRL